MRSESISFDSNGEVSPYPTTAHELEGPQRMRIDTDRCGWVIEVQYCDIFKVRIQGDRVGHERGESRGAEKIAVLEAIWPSPEPYRIPSFV